MATCALTSAGTQAAFFLFPSRMASRALVSRPVNALIPFVKPNSFLTRMTEAKFLVVQPMATSREDEAKEKRSAQVDPSRKQAPAALRQQSLSLSDSLDPFSLTTRSLQQMMETMDRLFSGALHAAPSASLLDPAKLSIRLPWDATEDDQYFHMRLDIPGFDKDEVKVRVEDGVLVVDAERKVGEKEEEKWEARSYGKFHTRVALGDNVEANKVKAKLKNGVLEVMVPKVKKEHKQVMDVKLEE